ncbi:hypothetical protein AVEN_175642-1 [Araneus ventricosus]|uniref:Uncharacterized protein n=1 Tax=Araneus ventricosus TaxID=182803 RepID=A0A4Y2QNQ8_ARAVE|nr:hypothetical protein AVEN_175642-1 [Araneus ventricosus]
MRTFGALSHGHGVSDSVLARWTQGMTALQHSCDGIEKFFSVHLNSSDQHLKISDSRVQRDNEDCRTMVDFNAESSEYIIDGGYLLHRVMWNRGSNFPSVSDNYVTCIRTKRKLTDLVIFNGYPENETIGGSKCAERARRTRKQTSSKVKFDETMMPTVSPRQIPGESGKNKNRLISILMNKFSSLNIACNKADEDADCLIVNSALVLAPTHPSIFVKGEDIDHFIILIGIFTFDNVYFLKPGKGKIVEKIFSPHTDLEHFLLTLPIIFYSYMP